MSLEPSENSLKKLILSCFTKKKFGNILKRIFVDNFDQTPTIFKRTVQFHRFRLLFFLLMLLINNNIFPLRRTHFPLNCVYTYYIIKNKINFVIYYIQSDLFVLRSKRNKTKYRKNTQQIYRKLSETDPKKEVFHPSDNFRR